MSRESSEFLAASNTALACHWGLQSLFAGLFGVVVLPGDLLDGLLVFPFRGHLVRLETAHDFAAQLLVVGLQVLTVPLVALGNLFLGLLVLPLGGQLLGLVGGDDFLLGRDAFGRQPTQLDHQFPRTVRPE